MNILNNLEKTYGGSTFNGKTGLVNLIVSFKETECICCSKKFHNERSDGINIGKIKKICLDCMITYKYKRYPTIRNKKYKKCNICQYNLRLASHDFGNKSFCSRCLIDSDPKIEEYNGDLHRFISNVPWITIWSVDQ